MRKFILLITTLIIFSPTAQARDNKIISLTWEGAEHLLNLGIVPQAVAEASGYRSWVVRPELPDEVIDAGLRTEPNVEVLQELQPDLIIISPMHEEMRPTLELIAPVESYSGFTLDQNNYSLQRQSYLSLACKLGRLDVANRRLREMDDQIALSKVRLKEHFRGNLPKVNVIWFSSPTVVNISGPNSMVQNAMNLLDIHPALGVGASDWGVTQVRLGRLSEIGSGVVLHTEPFIQKDILGESPLWQAMPFIKNDRFRTITTTWAYGGVFSIQYLADAVTTALLSIE